MSYYCLTIPISAPKECKQLLRSYSGGIPRLALFLWCMAQRNALHQEQESFGPNDITLAYESGTYKEHRNLADGFHFRKSDLLQDIEDVDIKLYDTYWSSVTREPTIAPQPTAQLTTAQKGESKEEQIKKKAPAKAPKSGLSKFKAEQTRQKNQDAKRSELLKNLPDGDIRSSGLVAHHLKELQDALATAREVA